MGLVGQINWNRPIDNNGDKWFGTGHGGVSKFDGTNWTTYTMVDGMLCNNIHAIVVDSANNKWLGTSWGVSMLKDTNSTNIINEKDNLKYPHTEFSVNKSGNKVFIQLSNKYSREVSLILYDLTGSVIQHIIKYLPLSNNIIKVNTSGISSGSYIFRIQTPDGNSACKKIMIMR